MNENLLYFKHWAPSGDLLTCLPGIRKVCVDQRKQGVIMQRLNVRPFHYDGAIYSIKDDHGNPVCMSEKQWDLLKPLLEAQDYIHHCEIYQGQYADYNLDKLREGVYAPTMGGDLYHAHSLIFPEMATNINSHRLQIYSNGAKEEDFTTPHPKTITGGKILINLTPRYRNQAITYYFLRDYVDQLLFIGTEEEHASFVLEYGFQVPYLQVDNFLELARLMATCKFFLGNQSMCWHIAEGLCVPRMVEINLVYCNVWPHTPGLAYPYTLQENCEKIFKRLYASTR